MIFDMLYVCMICCKCTITVYILFDIFGISVNLLKRKYHSINPDLSHLSASKYYIVRI